MIQLAGQVFGDLTVIEPTPRRQHGNVVWACSCACGHRVEVNANKLRFGITKSCGCRKGRVATERNIARTKHGHAKTRKQSPTYRTWQSMIARCTKRDAEQYPNYGGRGIKVCDRWTSFENFLADMGERPKGMTLDRKDNEGNYEPSNCRWATSKQQCNNRRGNFVLEWNGVTKTLSEWADDLGVGRSSLRERLRDGWSVEKTLTTPVKNYRPRRV